MQHILALKVCLKTDLTSKQGLEFNLIPHLENPHYTIKSTLVLTERTWFRSVLETSFDPKSLNPAILKISDVFLKSFKSVEEGGLLSHTYCII